MMARKMTWKSYREAMVAHYGPLVKQHPDSHRGVDWATEAGQVSRFRILGDMVMDPTYSVLDVGSGLGQFSAFLRRRGHTGRYVGIDLVAEMVNQASRLHPDEEFLLSEITDLDDDSFDCTVASGIFTYADENILDETLEQMVRVSRRLVAMNCLSSWANMQDPQEFHADPARVVTNARRYTARVILRHDYHPRDFTIVLFLEDSS